jgi:hypothetical protein
MHFRVKDKISFAPLNGGKRQEWTRAIKTKGGVSPRSVQRYTQRASSFVDNSLGDANLTVRDEVFKRMASNVGPSLVKYKHGRQMIVTSPEDQLLLQQTGMMSGWQMLMFNRILAGLSGISIHSTAFQDKQMPDYTIAMVKLLVNKTMQPRRVFRRHDGLKLSNYEFQNFLKVKSFYPLHHLLCSMTAHLLFDLVATKEARKWPSSGDSP